MSQGRGKGNPTSQKSKAVVPRGARAAARPQEGVMLAPKGYTAHAVEPAKRKDVLSVAKAMHRDQFAPRVQALFQPETDAAKRALETGIYIGWRCPEYKHDCQRVNDESRCFCDHSLAEHESYTARSRRVACRQCSCRGFSWIASRPEDIGEWWHQKRRNFDLASWRAKCKCKHTHIEHDPRTTSCRKCGCGRFMSDFLCSACDRRWEEHDTVFESEAERKQNGLPVGEMYLPFAELPNMRDMALTGRENDDTEYMRLLDGSVGYREPPANQRALTGPAGNDAPFRPGGPPAGPGYEGFVADAQRGPAPSGGNRSGFRPVYD